MTEKKAILKVEGQDLDLPIYTPTLGRDVIDVSKLVANGVFTFDPGFTSTASCESKITFIDGEVGKLLHRGYSIEELAVIRLSGSVLHPAVRRAAHRRTTRSLHQHREEPHHGARADSQLLQRFPP